MAKVSKRDAAKEIKRHIDSITRLEDGDILPIIEQLAALYGFHAVLLSPLELEFLRQNSDFLAKIGQK